MKKLFSLSTLFILTACQAAKFQPIDTIERIQPQTGYRLQTSLAKQNGDNIFTVILFSGGGTRAAALGYGVLEELNQQPINTNQGKTTLLESIDLVHGVSGGSVLAAYFSLHGKDTIPRFEQRFLKQNFQRLVLKQAFSIANLPRLTSDEFGRGDLLQEQFENQLFHQTTFGDLEKHRKGPFTVISATDMSLGNRIDFTQEYFDAMCLNLASMPLARAVAASSAVPLIFAPLTLNNNGGHCDYTLPPRLVAAEQSNSTRHTVENHREFSSNLQKYTDSETRPFIHLLDGGLTDNLGLRSLLDATEIYSSNTLRDQIQNPHLDKIVIISVNARNELSSTIDQNAKVPGVRDVASSIINIPIDNYSQTTIRRFREFVDEWNIQQQNNVNGRSIKLYFINLSLHDLPDSPLRDSMLNISTSFYLPPHHINDLKRSASILLRQSEEYQRLLSDLSSTPMPSEKNESLEASLPIKE